MKKERRCLKFTAYLYLPENEEYEELRYFSSRMGVGRLKIYDEFHGKGTTTKRMIGFDDLGSMMHLISKEYKRQGKNHF